MLKDTLEKIFVELGLSPYEIRAYTSLVTEGQLKATDISKIANIPQSKIYTVLDHLEIRGLIETYPGFPKEYKAIQPKIAANRLLELKEEKIKKMKEKIDISLTDIPTYIKRGTLNEKIWTLNGKESFPTKGLEILKDTKKSFLLCTVNFSINTQMEKEYKNAIKNGVKCKIIGTADKNTIKNATRYVKVGFSVKNIKHNFLRFAIFDEKSILFRLSQPERGTYTSVWVENTALAKIFTDVFNKLWENGKTVK